MVIFGWNSDDDIVMPVEHVARSIGIQRVQIAHVEQRVRHRARIDARAQVLADFFLADFVK